MKKWLLVVSILTFSSASFAQKIKVRKVKGNQAVIEFSGGSLQPGNVYELAPDEFGESSAVSTSRRYLVGLSFNFENTKADTSGAENETDINLLAKFGWNYGTFEVGPMVSYSSTAIGSVTTTTYKFGGFGDYNMIANTPGEAFIYGLGGYATMGQRDSGTGSKIDVMDFFVGPFAKWFPTGTGVGFRLDGGYIYQKVSGGVGGDATITGLAFTAGIIAYF
ncbi:hypothetical protein AZI87_14500 [Bdellovibrio bacteriovorus]|uniref:Outer membrane protein beta-barrel domain-containing protein n=1 Tax=Bdellovibrio bacteriovorus TaxID=959 RepID=A0A161PR21_BDEBC|nr:hypothetical protein [Bdellovibrio bacteriovorus]KYG63626.1 hypothetical protein AZI87_14500 [Bdellovibrio bacteriovorus]